KIRRKRVALVFGRVELVRQIDVAPAAAFVEPAAVYRCIPVLCGRHRASSSFVLFVRRLWPTTAKACADLAARTWPVRAIFSDRRAYLRRWRVPLRTASRQLVWRGRSFRTRAGCGA